MIKKAVIVNVPRTDDPHRQYLSVEFADGTFVDLTEKELKNAAERIKKSDTIVINGVEMRNCAALHHDD